jgi:hypothetical protein
MARAIWRLCAICRGGRSARCVRITSGALRRVICEVHPRFDNHRLAARKSESEGVNPDCYTDTREHVQ